MEGLAQDSDVTKYQFQIDDDKWDEWKTTVPRSKSLEKRIIELIEADTEGRVTDDARDEPHTDTRDATIDELLAGWEPDTEADARRAREETRRAVEWLRDAGGRRTRSEFVDELAGDSPLESRSWWERAVQPGLRHFADHSLVEYRPGHHDYQWNGSKQQ